MNLFRRIDRDFRHLFRQLLAAGWRVRNGRRHVLVYPPRGGHAIAFPGSCSDVRALRNMLAQVRKAERGTV